MTATNNGFAKQMMMMVPNTANKLLTRPRRIIGSVTYPKIQKIARMASTNWTLNPKLIKWKLHDCETLFFSLNCYKLTSTTSISLENLLRILPIGVVSKKDMGDLKILSSMVPCNLVAAFKVPTDKTTVPSMMNTDWNRPSKP